MKNIILQEEVKKFKNDLTAKLYKAFRDELENTHEIVALTAHDEFKDLIRGVFIDSSNEFLKKYGIKLVGKVEYDGEGFEDPKHSLDIDRTDQISVLNNLGHELSEFHTKLNKMYEDLDVICDDIESVVQNENTRIRRDQSYMSELGEKVGSFILSLVGVLVSFVAVAASVGAMVAGGLSANAFLAAAGAAGFAVSVPAFFSCIESVSAKFSDTNWREDFKNAWNELNGTSKDIENHKIAFVDELSKHLEDISKIIDPLKKSAEDAKARNQR